VGAPKPNARPDAGPQAREASAGRLDFLDALRGVAVGLVLLQHVGELLFPAVHTFTRAGIQLGQLGVMVFFLCSGFIIPATLERRPDAGSRMALRSFWISRVFRLYPLFWASLVGAFALVVAGLHRPAKPLGAGDWLANATMLPMLVGSPRALDLYWTLTYEMVFYLAVSILFLLGWHRRNVELSLAGSAVCLAAALVAEPLWGRPAPLGFLCRATMFTGTVLYRWHAGVVRARTAGWCVAVGLASGTVLLVSVLGGNRGAEGPGLTAMLTAWFGAYAVFGAGLALRRRTFPGWLLRLGQISYSVYLVQALVLIAVPATPHPVLTGIVWVAASLVISEITHRFLEQPAIRLGRRCSARWAPGRSPAHPTPPAPAPVPVTSPAG
jgi:peptidoglycan/LPS O-acetylase OafA/YrhL